MSTQGTRQACPLPYYEPSERNIRGMVEASLAGALDGRPGRGIYELK